MSEKKDKNEVPQELAIYGPRAVLEAMAWRVKYCTPNGTRLSTNEALALAQIALSSGLNPFIGEIWYIPGKGPQMGIRGLRRKAREQSTYYPDLRPMTSEEISEYDVRTEMGDVGYICELYRHDVLFKSVEINKVAGKLVMPVKPVIGIGLWRKAYPEIGQYKDDLVPHGKSAAWVAKKRAEADALNQAYDVGILPPVDVAGFGVSAQPNGDSFGVADDDGWTVVDPTNGPLEVTGDDDAPAADEKNHDPREGTKTTGTIAQEYFTGTRQIPTWAGDIRTLIADDPKRNAPVEQPFIQQIIAAAEDQKITQDRLSDFVQALCGHPAEAMTFGEARVLMPVVKDPSFPGRMAELFGG